MGQLRCVLIMLTAACATAESALSSAPVLLSVRVHDEAGAAVSNIRIRVSRRHKGTDTGLMSPLMPTLRSDAAGEAEFEIPTWLGRHMADSLTVATDPDFCQGLVPDTAVVPIRSDGGPYDHAEAAFQSAREAPLTRLQVGVSCGVRFPSFYMSTLRLAFDTVSATLAGDWFLGHSQSIPPQEGRFAGLRIHDVVHLTLTPEAPACDGVFTLTARVGGHGELLDADLEGEGGCFAEPAPPFYFVERDLGGWP